MMLDQSVSLFMQEVIDQAGVDAVKLINYNGSQLISKKMKMVLSLAGIIQIRIRRNRTKATEKLKG